MILLFAFCLYYVLHNRHCQIVAAPSLVNASSESLVVQKSENEILLPSNLPTKCTFVGFSDYRFIVSIILLILLGLFSIPIFGLTGFHVYLIARGRTTNEQVTGKFQHQGDVFTKGFFKNFAYFLCQPLYPKLKPSPIKRYNVEIFEQMAYGKPRLSNGKKHSTKKISTKVVYEEEKQPRRKKKKIIRNENGEKKYNT